jgi:hypothetical protein
MALFRYSGTISPGQVVRWWVGGNGWFTSDQTPQLDAQPQPTFPEGVSYTGLRVPLWYGDFTSRCDFTDFLGTTFWTYLMSVRNDGVEPCAYDFRVWVP